MDAFEQIVSKAFEARGYWTRIGFKADLDKATKKALEYPSVPRPEIDVLAYKPKKRELLLIECKSYLDSTGVQYGAFSAPDSVTANRFKQFHNAPLFEAVKNQVIKQLAEMTCSPAQPQPFNPASWPAKSMEMTNSCSSSIADSIHYATAQLGTRRSV